MKASKTEQVLSAVRKHFPKAKVALWRGEWNSIKFDVVRQVSFKDRHRHRKWGKDVERKLGPGYEVALTSGGYTQQANPPRVVHLLYATVRVPKNTRKYY